MAGLSFLASSAEMYARQDQSQTGFLSTGLTPKRATRGLAVAWRRSNEAKKYRGPAGPLRDLTDSENNLSRWENDRWPR